ncbi:hypothetical protein [Nocardiopsis prasina]|uniref:hypothetical protein n=1 Tax=Nocardiopsis prasina TaxID=2015 RepID=UPI00034752B7|nr:hypothetical protein [Nocardiopsis prasina]
MANPSTASHAERGRARIAAGAVSTIAVTDGLQVQWLLDPEGLDMAAHTRLTTERLAGADPSGAPPAR